jgi:integrase
MPRRGRGEGSITKRADGRWMARVDLGWRDGRRRYKSVYGRTRRQASDKLTKALREVSRLPACGSTIFGTAATLLLAQGVDPRTIMELLGHWQISLTLNTYSHALPALQHDAAARINASLSE